MAMIARAPTVDVGAWEAVEDVLCIRADGMGDVLMTAPAIERLRSAGPAGRRITLLTSTVGAEVARLLPSVDRVLAVNVPWVASTAPARPGVDLETIDRLASEAFDGAVIFTVTTQSALPAATWCRLAGIPRRLGHSRENPYHLLTDWVPDPEPLLATRHEVQRQLDLVAEVGASSDGGHAPLTVPAWAAAEALSVLLDAGVRPSAPWLPIHPGAAAPSRRYPTASFGRAADLLVADGWQVVLVQDRDGTAEQVAEMTRESVSVLGSVSVAGMAALLWMAPVAVVNNSGPAHLAAAVGTPAVVLYALTNPQHAPWRVPHRLLYHDVRCRNCTRSECPMGHHDCLRKVQPEAIIRAVRELTQGVHHGASVEEELAALRGQMPTIRGEESHVDDPGY